MAQKICNSCKELKDYEVFPKQAAHSTGRSSQCKACKSLRNKARYKLNRDEILAQAKAWQKANPEKAREYAKTAYRKDKAKRNAITRNYQAKKLNRTPKWLTKEHRAEIEKYYAEAVRLTQTLGELYSVDHIVPLQGKTVSGLHVPWNLQILPASQNSAKRNKFSN